MDAVTRALSTVDAVVCPVDCVSHATCLKVKRACKHLAKQFIILLRSGLSSFARASMKSPASWYEPDPGIVGFVHVGTVSATEAVEIINFEISSSKPGMPLLMLSDCRQATDKSVQPSS